MSEPSGLVTGENVREYFKDLLGQARTNQGVPIADVTEYYLVNLLSEFQSAEKLFVRDAEGSMQEEPLALILQRALAAERAERVKELRRLGDVSLYYSGFFSDHLEHKVVDVDYYMTMGHHAYSSLAQLLDSGRRRDLTFAGLYAELAEKFAAIVDLLNEISERLALTSQQGIVRLYERFLKTGSNRLARLLAEQGMVPALAGPPKGLQ